MNSNPLHSASDSRGGTPTDQALAAVSEWQRQKRAQKIHTHFDYPPIPDRSCDWSATYDDYEGGDGYDEPAGPIGHGATEDAAIADLVENPPREG